MEYIIYCDESDKKGKYYSNFYGGSLVRSEHLNYVINTLTQKQNELHLTQEIKWNKVSVAYLDKYKLMMDTFFELIRNDFIKVRIMFTQNCNEPQGLTKLQKKQGFFLLYYQFIKYAFGLEYSNPSKIPISLKLYFDILPDTEVKSEEFKKYIYRLQFQPELYKARIKILKENITEVDSKKHIILQCVDVILGSMSFRLNDKHKEKPAGSWVRGEKTRAKEALYKHINKRIRDIYPGFNIGQSTGTKNDITNRWKHPYRHWNFIPSNHIYKEDLTKGFKKK